MTTAVKTHIEAWQIYDGLRAHLRVAFAAEPWNIEVILRELTKTRKYSPNTWTDAYLGAMARALELRIVTFDSDFRAMPGVEFFRLRKKKDCEGRRENRRSPAEGSVGIEPVTLIALARDNGDDDETAEDHK